jgi:preprotein translocase subunit SecA
MLANLREVVTSQMMRVEIVQQAPPPLVPDDNVGRLEATHIDPLTGENDAVDEASLAWQPSRASRSAASEIDPKDPSTWGKVGRNEPCPCGSGKKYKHCHGRLA